MKHVSLDRIEATLVIETSRLINEESTRDRMVINFADLAEVVGSRIARLALRRAGWSPRSHTAGMWYRAPKGPMTTNDDNEVEVWLIADDLSAARADLDPDHLYPYWPEAT